MHATQTKTKKIIAFLIITMLAGFIPTGFVVREANAQIAVIDAAVVGSTSGTTAAVTSVAAAELAAKAVQTTTTVLVINNPADQAALAGVRASSAACDGIDQAEQVAATSDTFGDFSVIGGSPAQAVRLAAKLAALQAVLACRQAMLSAIDALIPTSSVGATSYSKKQAEISVEINSLKTRIESIKQQQTAEIKDVLKAIMVRIILTVSKNLTTEMVNKMVEKYKIQDYLAYGDAVATQVYSMKYINENFAGDARQQMMIRSLLQSEKFPEKAKTVQAFANSKAQEYLGTACGVGAGVDPNDANYFMKCLAAYGAPQSSPEFHVLQANSQAQAAMASAHNTTAAEIAQSDGYAPSRNCQGSIAQQKQIDDQYDQVYAEKDIAIAAAAKLKFALNQNPPKTTKEEYDRAQAAADQAIANAESLNEKGDPIIDICEAIDSPAKFVSESIGKFLEKNLVQDTDLKTDNLPFYAAFLSDVASNFLTNILTGGKSTSQVLKEAGVGALNGGLLAINTPPASTGTGTGTTTNPVGNVNIYANLASGGPQTTAMVAGQNYIITLDFAEIADEGLTRVLISGLTVAGGTNNLPLDQFDQAAKKVQFNYTPVPGPFTLRATFFGPQPSGSTGEKQLGPYSQNFTVSQVNGAVTLLPRGPALLKN